MKNNYNKLIELLKKDGRIVSTENTILKNELVNLAHQMDKKLLELLLSDEEVSQMFFQDINGIKVFDKQKFNWVINSRELLPDSYTSFSKNIGLIDNNNDFISKNDDVVLSFPNKDCMLEFDSTKEKEERKEIFFNSVLAKNEIDTLLDNKVFSNAKKYVEGKEETLEEFDKNDNLVIKGNNLLAMHSLLPKYKNQIKFMYWDTLYNTKDDEVPYNDSFKHSSWLVMMKNRLEIARKLLSDDGVFFIQCDDNEQAYLKVLCDEIFKRENFVNCITVKMSEASGVKMTHAKKRFPKLKEYILFYKGKKWNGFETIDKYKVNDWDKEHNIILEGLTKEDRNKLIELEEKEKNTEEDVEIANEILKKVKKCQLNDEYFKDLKIDKNKKEQWLFENSYKILKTAKSSSLYNLVKSKNKNYNQDIACELSKNNILFFFITDFNQDTKDPRLQAIFADKNLYKNPCDFWQDIKTTGAIANEGGVSLSNGKKPEKILQRLIKMTTKPGDICLDAFMGTATTAAVAMKMKRKFITIEQLDKHVKLGLQRLKNVIQGDETGISSDPEINWKGGGSFTYFELAKNNMKIAEKITKSDDKELINVYMELINEDFLNYRVDKEKLIENEEDFKKLKSNEQRNLLLELLDKNMLYINYSDIDDEDYNINEIDKRFTKSFYKDGKE